MEEGERPRIEQFLHGVPPALRDEILKTLLEIELELRRGARDPARREEFERRFPAHLAIVAAAFKAPTDRDLKRTARVKRATAPARRPTPEDEITGRITCDGWLAS